MGISLVHDHLALFAPPLTMPLRPRIPGGLFGIDRHDDMEYFTTSRGSRASYLPMRCHTGLDLAENEGRPVFAARGGQLVHINRINNDPDNLRMFVRHMAPGPQFFVTRYLHVKNPQIVVGADINQGHCIAIIGGDGDHLHFEIRQIVNTASPIDWDNDNTEPLDPLPFLYRWDKIYHERIAEVSPSLGDSAPLRAASVRREDGIWVFEVGQGDDWPIIPLVAPDEGERHLIVLLQEAYMNQKSVRLATREAPFFEGRRIITGARVIGES